MNISPYQPPANESFGEPLDQSSATVPASSMAGYVPPGAGGGYEPPSVEISAAPALDTTEEPTHQDVLKKKKSFMDDDDDDDLAARAAAIQKAEKARKDREADEAFRKAAEADGKFFPLMFILGHVTDLAVHSQETSCSEEIMVWWLVWRSKEGERQQQQLRGTYPCQTWRGKLFLL